MRDASEDFFLLDVREPHEVERASIGGVNIPLGQLAAHLDEIPRDRKIVTLCKMGGRSEKAARALHELGYEDVVNVQGGIDAWSQRIDPGLDAG